MFALPDIPQNNQPSIDDLKASEVSMRYLFIALQEVNNSLRDIFLSSLRRKHNDRLDSKRRQKMLTLLNGKIKRLEKNKNDNKIPRKDEGNIKPTIKELKPIITCLSNQKQNHCLCLENLDCLSSNFLATLKTINDDSEGNKFFHEHLLYNRVLPVNNLATLITLLESTLEVRNWLAHPEKPLETKDLTNCLHTVCILLPSGISKIYLDRLKIDTTAIQKHWHKLHKKNMSVYCATKRSKKHLKKTNKSFVSKEQENRHFAYYNKKSANIAKQEKAWKDLYTRYCREDSAFHYWTFRKLYNYIGKNNIKSMVPRKKAEPIYNSTETYLSFRYYIYPRYLLYVNLSFVLYEGYHVIRQKGNANNAQDKITAIFATQIKSHPEWTEKKNPFLTIKNIRNDIAHNRNNYASKDTTRTIFAAYLAVFTHLKMKKERAKFVQDLIVLFRHQNYKVDKKTGAKLTWDRAKKRYYYLGEDEQTVKFVADTEIEKRKQISSFSKRLRRQLQSAINTYKVKEPYKKQKDKRERQKMLQNKK